MVRLSVFLVYLCLNWIISSDVIVRAAEEEEEVCHGDGANSCPSSLNWDDDGYLVTYGPKQVVSTDLRDSAAPHVEKMERYMKGWSENGGKECLLKSPSCLVWAKDGECDANPTYMRLDCAPACFTCEEATQSFQDRCPMPAVLNDVWKPGSLDRMFERLANDTYYLERYHLQVIRRPGMKIKNSWRFTEYPWLIQLDDFLSQEECDLLIAQGSSVGYEPSTVLGANGESVGGASARTSSHTWCLDECYLQHAVPILKRIENMTGVPEANYEHLQLLEYQNGQYYKSHTDFIDTHVDRPQGVRILTVFLYLNDVELGGETNFPKLGVTVTPKRGRAVIWPSVLNENPNLIDQRTWHQAMPVQKGKKYGANAWRDFKTPYQYNCI